MTLALVDVLIAIQSRQKASGLPATHRVLRHDAIGKYRPSWTYALNASEVSRIRPTPITATWLNCPAPKLGTPVNGPYCCRHSYSGSSILPQAPVASSP